MVELLILHVVELLSRQFGCLVYNVFVQATLQHMVALKKQQDYSIFIIKCFLFHKIRRNLGDFVARELQKLSSPLSLAKVKTSVTKQFAFDTSTGKNNLNV